MFKMIAIDLDDTLLNDNHEIGREDREVLIRAKEAGIRLCMITGRNYLSAKPFLKKASFEDLMGCMNGAYIADPVTDRFLYQYPIDGGVCSEILKDIEKIGTYVNLYHDHEVVCMEKGRFTEYYRELTGVEAKPVGKLSEYALGVKAGKLLLIDETETLKQIQKTLEQKYAETVYLTFSKPTHLEVNSVHASKGSAVKIIAEHYNIPREEIIAIGNDENDISMIRFAGLGAAMGNSSDKVKENADFVTKTNNENGVAHVIKEALQWNR